MSKLIRVSNETYNELEQLMDKRQTFNQVVARLIDIQRMVLGIEPILRGQKAFQEFKSAREAREGGINK